MKTIVKSTFLIFLSLLLATPIIAPAAPAAAVSESILDFFDVNTILYFDPTGGRNFCLPSYAGDIQISGGTARARVWSGLISVGFTPNQAAGIIGNMQHESGFNPVRHEIRLKNRHWNNGTFNLQGNPGISYGIGLIQWSFGRRVRFMQYINANDPGLDLYSYFKQPDIYSTSDADRFIALVGDEVANTLFALSIQFLWDEMHADARYSRFFSQPDTVDDYTWFFLRHIEIPCTSACGTIALAKRNYAIRFTSAYAAASQFGGWAPPSSSTSNCIPTSGDYPGTGSGDTSSLAGAVMHYAWHTPCSSGNRAGCSQGDSGFARANITTQKPPYRTAIQSGPGHYIGGCGGNDCGGWVTFIIRHSGWDPSYNSNGGTVNSGQLPYVRSSSQWYCIWGCRNPRDAAGAVPISSADQLLPGDVYFSPTHTWLYVGNITGFGSKIASASYSRNCARSRAPTAGTERVFGPGMTIYRMRK